MRKCGAQHFKVRVMPEEAYILSKKTNDANVKIRDGLLDIKTKIGETPEGFEIFQPCCKFQFPVKTEELAKILESLCVDMTLDGDEYTFDEFCSMVHAHADLVLVKVEKICCGFSVNGIICEYAKVWFNDEVVETACCESEDCTAMAGVVEALGIKEEPNTNYRMAVRIRNAVRIFNQHQPHSAIGMQSKFRLSTAGRSSRAECALGVCAYRLSSPDFAPHPMWNEDPFSGLVSEGETGRDLPLPEVLLTPAIRRRCAP